MAQRIDPALTSLPTVDEYLSQLDLEKIVDAILGPEGTPRLAEYDLVDAKLMLYTAAEKWLARDLHDMQIGGVEEEYQRTLAVPYGEQVFRGFIDLQGTLHGRLNVTKNFAGKKVVCDWKTTANTLDKAWEDRLRDSWQWKKYLYFSGAEVMIYRGISRSGATKVDAAPGEKTRELILTRSANLEEEVLDQLRGVAIQREALISSGLTIWPRKMPSACGSFGRECPHFDDCRQGTAPRKAVETGRTFSYSSMDRFLLCPERYRRDVIEEDGPGDATEESNFGSAVHRALAELYTQARDKFQN